MKSVVAHSKGCLSVAYALEALALLGAKAAAARAKRAHYITLGAVVEFPDGYENVSQYLGALDWFGAMNSRRHVEHESVTGAWHHLNTMLPASMGVADVLGQAGR